MSPEPDDELRQKFDAAMAARDRDATDEASRLLAELVADPRADRAMLTHSYVQLGYLSKEVIGDLEAAIRYYRRAVENGPTHELGSLALFHALSRAGRWTQAFEEAERFLRLKRSQEYVHLFLPDFADGLPADAQEVFSRIRARVFVR